MTHTNTQTNRNTNTNTNTILFVLTSIFSSKLSDFKFMDIILKVSIAFLLSLSIIGIIGLIVSFILNPSLIANANFNI
jgi:hypothetical protein